MVRSVRICNCIYRCALVALCLLFLVCLDAQTVGVFRGQEKTVGKLTDGIRTTNLVENTALEVFEVLISYVYFEAEQHTSCERRNKRLNLAMFLLFGVAESSTNVRFYFTFPGERPKASSIIESVGVEHMTRESSIISRILNEKEPNVVLGQSSVSHPAADLCHHYHVLQNASVRENFRFFFVINDGVRGPFVDAHVANVRSSTPFCKSFLVSSFIFPRPLTMPIKFQS